MRRSNSHVVMCPQFSKKIGFNFIFVLVFFQKYVMTSVHKKPNIISQIAGTLFFLIKLICLAGNFKAIA